MYTYNIYEFTNSDIDKVLACDIIILMPLQVAIRDKALLALATNKNAKSDYPQAIEKKFRLRVQEIMSFADERDFYATKSLHFEKLKGNRSHQHSIRLNDQWRMILEFEGEAPNKQVIVVGVEAHYE